MGPLRIILGGQLVTIVAILARHLSSLVKQACNATLSARSLAVFGFKVGDAFFCCHVFILSVLATPAQVGRWRRQGFSKVALCVPHPPKREKEREAGGRGRPPHALSLLLWPPQAASLS